MARITVEDCLKNIPSRFELIVIAAKRARQIASHSQPSNTFNDKGDKPTLIALKEIADSTINLDQLYQNKTEKEKTEMDDMFNQIQAIDEKIAEKDIFNNTSNVQIKQAEEIHKPLEENTGSINQNNHAESSDAKWSSDPMAYFHQETVAKNE